jgi:hypothetical protein
MHDAGIARDAAIATQPRSPRGIDRSAASITVEIGRYNRHSPERFVRAGRASNRDRA